MEQILFAVLIPFLEERISPVVYRHNTNTAFGLALHYLEAMFLDIDVFTFQVKQLGHTNSAVYQHQDDLSIEIVFLQPQSINFFLTERRAICLVRVLVLEFKNIHVFRVVFHTDFVLHRILIHLAEQHFQFAECGIILTAVVYNTLQVSQLQILEHSVMQGFTGII